MGEREGGKEEKKEERGRVGEREEEKEEEKEEGVRLMACSYIHVRTSTCTCMSQLCVEV